MLSISVPNDATLRGDDWSDTAPELAEAARLARVGVVAEHLDYRASRSVVQEPEDIRDGIDAMSHLISAIKLIQRFGDARGNRAVTC